MKADKEGTLVQGSSLFCTLANIKGETVTLESARRPSIPE